MASPARKPLRQLEATCPTVLTTASQIRTTFRPSCTPAAQFDTSKRHFMHPSTIDSARRERRVRKELDDIAKDDKCGARIVTVDRESAGSHAHLTIVGRLTAARAEDLRHMVAVIKGPADSPYQDGNFQLVRSRSSTFCLWPSDADTNPRTSMCQRHILSYLTLSPSSQK